MEEFPSRLLLQTDVEKQANQFHYFATVTRFFPLTWFLAARFTLSPFQSTKRRSDSQTNTPWNFISRRTASVGAYILRTPIVTGRGGIERGGGSIPQLEEAPSLRAFERKRNSGGGWHVSRLSVFTEIPCTLRPITFVTDYSTKVSRRARAQAETYPDKLHRANRQCSQMEPEARRLFKQEASRSCGFHDCTRENLSTPVITNFTFLEMGLILYI